MNGKESDESKLLTTNAPNTVPFHIIYAAYVQRPFLPHLPNVLISYQAEERSGNESMRVY